MDLKRYRWLAFALALITLAGVTSQWRENASKRKIRHLIVCQNNLKSYGLTLQMYANDSPGELFPPLSSTRGMFMFEPSTMYPEYFPDSDDLFCPACKTEMPPQGTINNDCYWYLGYALPNEETALAFLNAYEAFPESDDFPDYFEVNQELPNGTMKIHRLRNGIERIFIKDTQNPNAAARIQSAIPVAIERPGIHDGGGHVLYLDGHYMFQPYPGEYPMTEAFIEGLRSIEAKKH